VKLTEKAKAKKKRVIMRTKVVVVVVVVVVTMMMMMMTIMKTTKVMRVLDRKLVCIDSDEVGEDYINEWT
jgi:flagellar basal body-associated protein FliL